jgi:hypothetical protein
MASFDLRVTLFRRAAPWLLAGGFALGCGSSSKISFGNDANLPDVSGAAGANVDARGETGEAGAAGTGAPDASVDVPVNVDATAQDSTIAPVDAVDAPIDTPGAEDAPAPDASGAAGAPAPPACVLGTAAIGNCVIE